jgi:hypothetical protein
LVPWLEVEGVVYTYMQQCTNDICGISMLVVHANDLHDPVHSVLLCCDIGAWRRAHDDQHTTAGTELEQYERIRTKSAPDEEEPPAALLFSSKPLWQLAASTQEVSSTIHHAPHPQVYSSSIPNHTKYNMAWHGSMAAWHGMHDMA